jgi:hypothetical protein
MKFDAVSYVMSEEDFTALKQKINETDHTFMLASERKDIVPPYVNMEEFKKDLDLYKKCKELLKILEIVHEKILDTYIGAGSDAFGAARKIYYYVKGLVKVNMPGSNVIYDELRKLLKNIK